MRILHTSDWHIGHSLYGKKRYDEFEVFFAWLLEAIQHNKIDALLVAGDVFDTITPSNRAQQLYYRFLCRVAASSCRHVVIIAGNHDSPSFLNAPRELLEALDVHVIGCVTESLHDEVLVLCNEQGAAELIVCAVPYLRDRDIRVAEAGESVEDKERKLIDGIRNHYASVAALAEQKRAELDIDVPIVGMGHLFAAGGQTTDGDGVRELYVGSLAHVTAGIFAACFDYVALGHLHMPQKVAGRETARYSGSPLPMGFGEEKQHKSVCQVAFEHKAPGEISTVVELLKVPVFQRLQRIEGDWSCIKKQVQKLTSASSSAWLEVIYDGIEVIADLRERLEALIVDTQLQILRIKNNRIIDHVLGQRHSAESLDDLSVNDVFERCLAAYEVPENQRPELFRAYQEVVLSLDEDDTRAE